MQEDEYLGELLVSLTYLPQAERLNVGIIEARNLKALSMHVEAGEWMFPTVTMSGSLSLCASFRSRRASRSAARSNR